MTELQYFRLFATEFASVSDETVQQWLTIAALRTEIGCLDADRAAMARGLYAAHLLSLSVSASQGKASAPGPVTSEKEGDLQRTYGALKRADTFLGQTQYGQQYLEITRVCAGSAIMTRV